ncbi:tRNA pseudouridine(55) synthase TruB [Salinibacterium hongtaonis]|uniref:tRNA pseudouridine(55) synthase TruB n=1 Tax=Homoserinimonas hongtaonis TaxID=2079791 RepID=UPI001F540300|nr:tRNA pseudouridine(55) synthase TruB [Salinibacterium hongtaonis]
MTNDPATPVPPRNGIVLIDKPQGITSHDVVSRTRRMAQTRKVGHAGTLDPMATGLLVLGVNSSTRLLTYLVGLDKVYLATIRLGAASSTDDAEGQLGERSDTSSVTPARIAEGIALLTGEIEQVPSTVSAIKVGGKRAYALARAGEEVELASRRVTISEFTVVSEPRTVDGFVDVDVRVACSSGTYIRALARDLGVFLGVGGHLTALRRTSVGPFDIADALVLTGDREADVAIDFGSHLLHPAAVAGQLFATVRVDSDRVRDLENGKRVPLDGVEASDDPIAVVAPDGRLVGLVRYNGTAARVLVNFPTGA